MTTASAFQLVMDIVKAWYLYVNSQLALTDRRAVPITLEPPVFEAQFRGSIHSHHLIYLTLPVEHRRALQALVGGV